MKCDVCNAEVKELRRGRCWGCYTRWVESRPVGVGACCVLCSERRRDNLRSVELLGSWMPVCHNCSSRVMKLDPLPQSIGEIRKVLQRDRRFKARRFGKNDTRVFPRDRRADDRRRVRSLGRDDSVLIDEEMILEIEELAEDLGAPRDGGDDLTQIRDLPLQAQ